MSRQMRVTQMAADATSTAIQVIAAANIENSTRQSVGPKVGGPVMKQPTFKMDTEDKYDELKNFRLKINGVFKLYNMPDIENIAIKKLTGKYYNCQKN